jgi:hypothetical protein
MEEEVSELERRANHDVAVIELSSDQAPPIPPLEQTFAATLGDAVELGGQAADV